MKKLSIAIVATLLLTGCEFERKGGKCVGITETKKPGIEYEISLQNVIVGAIFFQTVAAPLVVGLKAFECPVEK